MSLQALTVKATPFARSPAYRRQRVRRWAGRGHSSASAPRCTLQRVEWAQRPELAAEGAWALRPFPPFVLCCEEETNDDPDLHAARRETSRPPSGGLAILREHGVNRLPLDLLEAAPREGSCPLQHVLLRVGRKKPLRGSTRQGVCCFAECDVSVHCSTGMKPSAWVQEHKAGVS